MPVEIRDSISTKMNDLELNSREMSDSDEDFLSGGFSHVDTREQEVTAHIGTVSYEGLDSPILLSQDLSGGCGGKIWECANVMINYLIWKNQQLEGQLFQGQKIVEIGSGTGLVGLAIAKLCPSIQQLVMTDQLPMMNLMEENIKLNKVSHNTKAEILNWGEEIPSDANVLNADVVIASDCVYLEIAFIPLIETFFALTEKESAVIYLTYCKRRKADKKFFQLARKKFVFEEVLEDPNREDYRKKSIQLFRIKRK